MAHEFLSTYLAKTYEYLLAIGYLLLFIPFWKYVQGARKPAEATVPIAARHAGARAAARATARAATLPSWFQVPAGIHLHPGHTWARVEPDGLVSIGADDF